MRRLPTELGCFIMMASEERRSKARLPAAHAYQTQQLLVVLLRTVDGHPRKLVGGLLNAAFVASLLE
jgi:hypothetical protein